MFQQIILAFNLTQLPKSDLVVCSAFLDQYQLLLRQLSLWQRWKYRHLYFELDGTGEVLEFIYYVPKPLVEPFISLFKVLFPQVHLRMGTVVIPRRLVGGYRAVASCSGDIDAHGHVSFWQYILQSCLQVRFRIGFNSLFSRKFRFTYTVVGKRHLVGHYLRKVVIVPDDEVGDDMRAIVVLIPNKVQQFQLVRYQKYLVPTGIPPVAREGTYLGDAMLMMSSTQAVYVADGDRAKHLYVLGKTGVGKSTFLLGQILASITDGQGVFVLDPHGDLIDEIVGRIPKKRINDVIYCSPAEPEGKLGIELLPWEHANQHLLVSNVIALFKRMFGYSWGPRLEYILRNTLLLMAAAKIKDLRKLLQLLCDEAYLRQILATVNLNQRLDQFWHQEFLKQSTSVRREWVAPIQNKIGQLFAIEAVDSLLVNTARWDPRACMDQQKIFLCKLPRGALGDDAVTFLGATLISLFEMAAMSRVNVAQQNRVPFTMFVDEFQVFATETFATMLSEIRKYQVRLVLAHQYITQLDEKLRDAVFGNIGNFCLFTVGSNDARYLSGQIPELPADSFYHLPKYHFYSKFLARGTSVGPFLLKSALVRKPAYHHIAAKIKQQSLAAVGVR